MKNSKNDPISFGITLTPESRTGSENVNRRRENAAPKRAGQVPAHPADSPRMLNSCSMPERPLLRLRRQTDKTQVVIS